ncbi:SurA N-terminal domain-containing protein [Gracilinema caldarium]|uniref:peptidylprolyl isomerase n=1 Tax=Gracilinema caldarium TaxID=215591 RepID=UPI0026E963DA|nr:SurA N-terminal domain-containing protein [Gracilinema caldarium]
MASKEKKPVAQNEVSGWQEFVRRFKAHPALYTGSILITLFTVIAFVLVPAMAPKANSLAEGGRLSFGSYDGVPIEFIPGNYFAQQRDYYSEQLRSSGQDQNNQYAAFQVWRAAFESTVIQTAALQEMKKTGYKTPEVLVDKRMAALPVFQENGKFSAARYKAISEADRMNLRRDLEAQIALERYMEDTLNLRISSQEKDFVISMASPERSFDMVVFPLASYPDSEVAAFISANPDLFKQVHLSKITISSSEGDAKKVYDSVKNGTVSFEDAAKTHSKDEFADKGGDTGLKYAYELATEITDTASKEKVLNLTKGSLSEIVKGPSGWAFYRAEEDPRPVTTPDKALLEKARSYMVSFEKGKIEDYLIAQANSFAEKARTMGFANAASAMALEKKSFGPLSLNYGDIEIFKGLSSMNVKELASASINETFWKTAFSTPLQTPSKPFVVGDNVIVLNPVSEIKADDSTSAVINYYYNYVAGQYSERTLRNYFLNSKKLKDQFFDTFVRTFMASNK